MAVRRDGDDCWADSREDSRVDVPADFSAAAENPPSSRLAGYQVRLNPAVMLFVLAVVPASSIDVVSLSDPNSICSTLSLLCHCASAVDDPAPAENVVP